MSRRHFGYFARRAGHGITAPTWASRAAPTPTRRASSRATAPSPAESDAIDWRLSQYSGANFDFQGRLQNWIVEPLFRMQFKQQTYLGIGYTHRYERIFEEEFGAKRAAGQGAFFGLDPERSTYRKEVWGFRRTAEQEVFGERLGRLSLGRIRLRLRRWQTLPRSARRRSSTRTRLGTPAPESHST